MTESRREDPRERSLGELAHELGSEAATLVRQEVELAKAERLRPALAKVAGDDEADGEDGRRRGPILWIAGLAAGFVAGVLMPGGRQA